MFRASPWRGTEPSDWQDVFAVYAGGADAPAMLGEYTAGEDSLTFTPRFKPAAGVTLKAVFRPRADAEVKAIFSEAAPAPAESSTRVAAIYPSASVWPANVLKFYILFSAPMTIGDAWKRVRFRDAGGAIVEGAFVEIDQELWDREGRRLTILFDPGRIKRGLKDNETEGTPFVTGQSYTLEIDSGWRDARGAPLIEGATKTIICGSEARLPVDPGRWKITPPSTRDERLIVDFPRPLDHALALRTIHVVRDGAPVEGGAHLAAGETRWVFAPRDAWTPGAYALHVDRTIEDLAGNKLGRLFDVDTSDPTQNVTAPPGAVISFNVV